MLKVVALFALSFALLTTSVSAQDSTKIKHIRELLDVMGSGRLGVQVMTSMLQQYKKSFPDVDAQFWDDFLKEVKPDDLVNMIIPIYDKYFSDDDIRQLITFYNTPVGKKLVENLPAITQESMSIGMEWGKQIAGKVLERLRQKGYLKNG
jgi:hypothetical protein